MAEKISLFSDLLNKQRIINAANVLTNGPDSGTDNNLPYILGKTLLIIANSGDEFDKHCQINIKRIGQKFIEYLAEVRPGTETSKIELIGAITYRIILEYELSINYDLPFELSRLKSVMDEKYETFALGTKQQMDFTRRDMPLSMLKEMLNSDEIHSLRDVSFFSAEAQKKIDTWQTTLNASSEKVAELQKSLNEQKDAFNFVGLHQGFADLEQSVSAEKAGSRKSMFVFGILMILPSAMDFWLVTTERINFDKSSIYGVIATFIASITITLLLLYFFRISLRSADSCKAQLVQIRLRMTLCRFIQNYAEYSSEIRIKNPDILSKFENLIFSGIVGTEDKLPSTFDGIEQIASIVKAARSK